MCAAQGKPYDGDYRGGMQQFPHNWNGSWNIRVIWRCAEYAATDDRGSRQWIIQYCKRQLTNVHSFMGKELFSRLYGPWNVAAITTACQAAHGRHDSEVAQWTSRWLRAWYFFQSLVALPVTNQNHHKKVAPFVTVPTVGMRTPEAFQDHSCLDAIFDWSVNGRDPGRDIPHTYWPLEVVKLVQHPGEYWELKDVYVHGDLDRVDSYLYPSICSKVDVWFERYEHGSACWVSTNINGNTPPTLAAVGYEQDNRKGYVKWLHPHPASRPTASGDNGAVKDSGSVTAWFQDHRVSATLPAGPLHWSCVLSPAGFEIIERYKPQPPDTSKGWLDKLHDLLK